MRIAHIISYFQPQLGYQEYYLALHQLRLKHKVLVITSERFAPFPFYNDIYQKMLGDRKSPKIGVHLEQGVPTVRLPVIVEYPPNLFMKGLNDAIRNFSPDVIQVHGVFSSLIHHISKDHDAKIVADEHMVPFLHQRTDYYNQPLKRLYIKFIWKFLWNKIEQRVDSFFVTKEEVKSYFLRFTKKFKDIPVIPVGVDLNIFNPIKYRENDIKEELEFAPDTFILFYSGKIVPGKGIEKLFSIFKALSRRYDVGLLLIGNGPERFIHDLQKHYSNENVKRISFIPHSDLPRLMMAGNVGCWLGRPSVSINEMIAMGRPVLVKSFEGEDLARAGHRFIRKYTSLGDCLRWVSWLIENRDIYSEIQRDALNYARNSLDWSRITKKVTRLYL